MSKDADETQQGAEAPDDETQTQQPDEPADEAPEAPETPARELSGTLKTLTLAQTGGEVVELSVAQRLIGLKVMPYDVIAEHPVYGKLLFKQGAFGAVDPTQIRLRMDHEDPPTGLGRTFADKADGAFLEFKVSKTSRGNDQLELAKDGVSSGVSVGFYDVAGDTGPRLEKINGEWVTVYGPSSAQLTEASTTWRPTFAETGITHMLSHETGGTAAERVTTLAGEQRELMGADEGKVLAGDVQKMLGYFEEFKERMRMPGDVPAQQQIVKPALHQWARVALQLMRGQAVSEGTLKQLALADVVTSDNPGLVPDVLVKDFDDLIDPGRPFINSLRQIAPPDTGMSLIVPAIQTRAQTGAQSGEKADITGTVAPKVGTITFPYSQVFGGADIAIQLLNRGDASFFDLLTQLLAEAYSLDAEGKALAALLDPAGTPSWTANQGDPVDGGTLDPTSPNFGVAWQNSITTYRKAPDTIWMDSAAVAAFIDAKNQHDNSPLYSNLAANFTAANGAGGLLSGMRPVYVPALDDEDVDVIVGPSRSYVYAEDPQRTLQVDVPSKAGRDIALVGGFFFGPRAPEAFTTYTIES
jgi:phage head maturation protease